MDYTIYPASGLKGTISVSTDKSISHRALLLGAIANGTTKILDLSASADVKSTENCLDQLDISIDKYRNETFVHGVGLKGFTSPSEPLDAGNSGTTIRLLSGLLAGQNFSCVITGDDSLKRRPMARIIAPLQQMGAKIESNAGKAPLSIHGSCLLPIQYQLPVASAQVKSCVLLAGLSASGITSVTEPFQSRDHTEKMLPDFGVPVQKNGLTVAIQGKAQPKAMTIEIPGDISSAAFFMIAATLVPNSYITIERVGLNPTRLGIIEVLQQMGANISLSYLPTSQQEPMGNITIQSAQLTGVEIRPHQIPQLIDELPIIAIAATCARGQTFVSGANELRVKESDRLKSITTNLRAMGIQIEETEDGFIIDGPQTFHGAVIESFLDHRIAMAFSIAGLIAKGKTVIKNADCVAISMPDFYEVLETIRT